jgi:hypothetical protein
VSTQATRFAASFVGGAFLRLFRQAKKKGSHGAAADWEPVLAHVCSRAGGSAALPEVLDRAKQPDASTTK